MKKLQFTSAALLLITVLQAQSYKYDREQAYAPTANEMKYTIYSTEYKEGKKKIEEFIHRKNLTIVNQSETKDSHFYEFNASSSMIASIDSFCQTLGYVSNKNLNSHNNQEKLSEEQLKLQQLQNKKAEYEKMLARIDSVKSKLYYEHWEKIRGIDEDIFDTQKKINLLQSVKDVYEVNISINDEQSSPTSSKVNFVHMPGAEYVYFIPENPLPGISFDAYQGVFLKYLFTKGKSYFSLGALKAVAPDKADSLSYSELFTFVFGQDWYSRHMGRGNNKFLNLYIGYQAGFSIGYNSRISKGIPYLSPSTGIELFKNKYFLIDTNVNYYLPVSEENLHLRGWRMGGSLNFTF